MGSSNVRSCFRVLTAAPSRSVAVIGQYCFRHLTLTAWRATVCNSCVICAKESLSTPGHLPIQCLENSGKGSGGAFGQFANRIEKADIAGGFRVNGTERQSGGKMGRLALKADIQKVPGGVPAQRSEEH